MLVQPGTVLQIDGAIELNIPVGAGVINDGRIELQNGAWLNEAPGAPTTGTGTEHAWMEEAIPVNASEPGGLGLELTSSDPIGPMELVRGHQPFVLANGEESVARWFKFEAGEPAQLDQLVFHFDVTELNGSIATSLDLHGSNGSTPPWVPMLAYTGPDQLSLIVDDADPREYLTAFDFEAVTSVMGPEAIELFSVSPTITDGLVHIRSTQELAIEHIELFDLRGAQLPINVIHATDQQNAVIDLASYVSGPLFLRINGDHLFKLMRP